MTWRWKQLNTKDANYTQRRWGYSHNRWNQLNTKDANCTHCRVVSRYSEPRKVISSQCQASGGNHQNNPFQSTTAFKYKYKYNDITKKPPFSPFNFTPFEDNSPSSSNLGYFVINRTSHFNFKKYTFILDFFCKKECITSSFPDVSKTVLPRGCFMKNHHLVYWSAFSCTSITHTAFLHPKRETKLFEMSNKI